jgi:hypothetical protein
MSLFDKKGAKVAEKAFLSAATYEMFGTEENLHLLSIFHS